MTEKLKLSDHERAVVEGILSDDTEAVAELLKLGAAGRERVLRAVVAGGVGTYAEDSKKDRRERMARIRLAARVGTYAENTKENRGGVPIAQAADRQDESAGSPRRDQPNVGSAPILEIAEPSAELREDGDSVGLPSYGDNFSGEAATAVATRGQVDAASGHVATLPNEQSHLGDTGATQLQPRRILRRRRRGLGREAIVIGAVVLAAGVAVGMAIYFLEFKKSKGSVEYIIGSAQPSERSEQPDERIGSPVSDRENPRAIVCPDGARSGSTKWLPDGWWDVASMSEACAGFSLLPHSASDGDCVFAMARDQNDKELISRVIHSWTRGITNRNVGTAVFWGTIPVRFENCLLRYDARQ